MLVERAMLSRALMQGAVTTLVSRGVEPRHFPQTPDGEECAAVYEWATSHARRYNASPSQQLLRERFPDWRGESSSDSLDALVDLFLVHVKRRLFAAKVTEFARIEADPSRWDSLDEAMFDAARDLAAFTTSSRVSRLSQMHERYERYQSDATEGERPGFQLGIPQFDEVVGNVRPGNVVVVAGYMGLGKSSLSTMIALNAVDQGHPALFLPLEMSRHEVLDRVDTMLVNFPQRLLRDRALGAQDLALWRSMANQYRRVEADFSVVDMPASSCTVSRVYAEVARHRPAITVVDYVQLMNRPRRNQQGWESLAEIVNDLKSVALSSESVGLIVSQDNREAAREGSTLSNMGGSMDIGRAADVYIGMSQTEEMYEQNLMDLRLLKARNAPRNRVARMHWDPSRMHFEPFSEGQQHRAFLRAVS